MTLPWAVRAVDRWGFLVGVTGFLANVRAVTTALGATVLVALARFGSADTTWMPHPRSNSMKVASTPYGPVPAGQAFSDHGVSTGHTVPPWKYRLPR